VSVIPAQRRQHILDTVRDDGAVSIRTLASELQTSTVTIRRDLDYLDSVGELTRTHGGALGGLPSWETAPSEKFSHTGLEKEVIGSLASTLVRSGDVVAIGPGTTTEALARTLARRTGLTIVTNSLLVASAFGDALENEVMLTGGTVRGSVRALVGEATNRTLRGIHVDITFLSADGIDTEFGLSTSNLAVADSDRSLASAGQRVVALVDHTKFGVRASIQTVAPRAISDLVTDDGSPPNALAAWSTMGARVHVAKTASGHSDAY
jgi:DeoR/GlpR family transcriptional regulator of sugar metabolism